MSMKQMVIFTGDYNVKYIVIACLGEGVKEWDFLKMYMIIHQS